MSQEEAEEPLRSLSLDYLNLLINGEAFSDVTFSVDGRLVHAHRCILAARSLFFRKLFCGPQDALPFPLSSRSCSSSSSSSSSSCGGGVVIPVTSVGYDVFLLVLQFLYSGQVSIAPPPKNESSRPSSCSDRRCWHAHCSATVDLALDTLAAARSFGVEQLVLLAQRQLASMVEKASIEDVMRVLMASRKHDLPHLWASCSHLVANSGLPSDVLAKHLSLDTLARIEDLRLNSSSSPRRAFSSFSNDDRYHHHNNHRHHNHHHHHHHQKVRRMRRALDSSDVELVRLMVMSEGLNLDDALALHYAVERCTREVVKALLELGAADVNRPAGPSGKTPLHVAAEMACPDMVAVLLDHHADPNSRTADGVTPLDILRSLTSDFLFKGAAVPGLAHIEPNKLRLCLELVQSAAMVASREEEAKTTAGNVNVGFSPDAAAMYTSMHPESSNSNGMGNPSFDSRMLYLNLGMAAAAAAAQFGYNKMSDGSEEDKSSSNRSQGCGGGFGPSSMYSPHGFP